MPKAAKSEAALLYLLQLASPMLPVGAYSYSEGIETLVFREIVTDAESLKHWLEQEFRLGAIRLEAAVMVRAYRAAGIGDRQGLGDWNAWLSAAKETEELRNQSWQMGTALSRLLVTVQPQVEPLILAMGGSKNFAIAFAIAASHWQIDEGSALLGYLQSWATNLINAGVKLVPLGQTSGQQLLLELQPTILEASEEIQTLEDSELASCGWGLALASMAHETLYTRLFRS